MSKGKSKAEGSERTLADLVFVGLNRRVIALDRYTGAVAWAWRAPRGAGFVSLLLDGDRLIATVAGYTFCLDPLFGQVVWENPLKGYGTGLSSLASVHGSTGVEQAAAIAQQQQQAAAGTAATT